MKRAVKKILPVFLSVVLGAAGCGQAEEKETVSEKPALEVIDDEAGDLFREADQKLQVQEEKRARLFPVREFRKEKKTYTVMVYIIGSDLESRGGQATKDMEEMRQSGLDYANTNLVLYTGGARRWVSDIPNDRNCVIDMSDSGKTEIIANTETTADMGSPETLREFINFCTENYPAEHYGLILWDHGGGPLWGYGSDQLFENDSLILKELKNAMDQTVFGSEKKLDFVGFDACLMGTAENANLWQRYAEYFVASEELEPGGGWDYRFLSVLNETDDAEEIVREIVSSYEASIEGARSEYFNPEYTLSAADLSGMGKVVEAVNALSLKMKAEIEEGGYSYLRGVRGQTREFGRGRSYDLIDLSHFAEQLADRYPAEAGNLQNAVREMIVARTGNVPEAGGLSLYLPSENRELLEAAGKFMNEDTDLSPVYRGFMDVYEEKWLAGGKEDWMIADPVISGDEITLQLTKEQAAGAKSYVSFLVRQSNGNFGMTTIHLPFTPDDSGVLHIPLDPYLVSMETEDGTLQFPASCKVTAYDETGTDFQTMSTFALSGMEYFRDFINLAGEKVNFTIRCDNDSRACIIRDIVTDSSSVALDGKGSVDISTYESVGEYCFGRIPSYDENGNMMPFFSWTSGGWKGMNSLPAEEGIRFRMRPASEFHREMICQVLLKDSSGNIYASKYINLPQITDDSRIQTETENGVLTFSVHDDYAELVNYTGTDKKLVIPEEAGGKTVTLIGKDALAGKSFEELVVPGGLVKIDTYALNDCRNLKTVILNEGLKEIDDYAFRSCRSLTEIHIPDSVERIGRGAFFSCDLETAVLPAGLRQIGRIPYAGNRRLKEIVISENNTAYRTEDGVLFTGDGRELIQYPNAKGASYGIPEGTEKIAYGAFAYNSSTDSLTEESTILREVSFPESLKEIGNMAFFNCCLLQPLKFPENLVRIGDFAFGADYVSVALIGMDLQPELFVPSKTEQIGRMAFAGIKTASFKVDENNRYYASAGGFITNKHKDTLLMMPSGIGTVIEIPDGITTLAEDVFWDADDKADFIIPDSVFRFPKEVFPVSYNRESDEMEYAVTIHCSEGSAAAEYAEKYDIRYDYDTRSIREKYLTEVIVAGEAEMIFHVYPSHAVLVTAEGKKCDLDIPETVDGVPVTEFRKESEYGNLYASHFRTVRIPSGVTFIDRSFFDEVIAAEYEADQRNTKYSVKDGVLFDRSGTVLVDYPADREDREYVIPDGTEIIAEYSFRCGHLKCVKFADSVRTVGKSAFMYVEEVYFNEGLKEIGDYAFSACMNLNEIILPESLEKLGRRAFDLTYADHPEVKIPGHLKVIQRRAIIFKDEYLEELRLDDLINASFPMFPGLKIGRYSTSDDNPNCSVTDGMLMTDDGTGLCSVPSGRQGECRIPYGVELIDPDAFDECTEITDLYIPETVSYGVSALPRDDTGNLLYTVHCVPGSEIARSLSENNLSWVPWDGS